MAPLKLFIEYVQETDGRWIAEVIGGPPGVLAYGKAAAAAALRVLAKALTLKGAACR